MREDMTSERQVLVRIETELLGLWGLAAAHAREESDVCVYVLVCECVCECV